MYTSASGHSVDCSEFIWGLYTDIDVSYMHMNKLMWMVYMWHFRGHISLGYVHGNNMILMVPPMTPLAMALHDQNSDVTSQFNWMQWCHWWHCQHPVIQVPMASHNQKSHYNELYIIHVAPTKNGF